MDALQLPPPASSVAEAFEVGDGQQLGPEYDLLGDDFENLYGPAKYYTGTRSYQNIVPGITETTPINPSAPSPTGAPSCPAQRGKRVASFVSSLGAKKHSIRQSIGSSMYQRHVEVVQETSNKLLAILNADEVSSNKPKEKTDEVMDALDEMVADGLLVDADPLWCYSVESLVSSERASMFLSIKRNPSRLAWLKWQFQKDGGQLYGVVFSIV